MWLVMSNVKSGCSLTLETSPLICHFVVTVTFGSQNFRGVAGGRGAELRQQWAE